MTEADPPPSGAEGLPEQGILTANASTGEVVIRERPFGDRSKHGGAEGHLNGGEYQPSSSTLCLFLSPPGSISNYNAITTIKNT